MRRDIFLALALFAAACGDDSSSDDSPSDGKPTEDAGRDSSQQTTPDTGTADAGKDAATQDSGSDAGTQSAALTEAQKTAGVSATQARADLLIAAFCAKAPGCGSPTSEAACNKLSQEMWTNLVDNQVDDACKDAELDRYACYSSKACSELETGCTSFADAIVDLCPDDDAGMP